MALRRGHAWRIPNRDKARVEPIEEGATLMKWLWGDEGATVAFTEGHGKLPQGCEQKGDMISNILEIKQYKIFSFCEIPEDFILC